MARTIWFLAHWAGRPSAPGYGAPAAEGHAVGRRNEMLKPTAAEILAEGRAILDPVLVPHGFGFALEREARGSGGAFATASYSRGDRRLELRYRSSLGLVRYHLRSESISHEELVYAVLGGKPGNEYPGFSHERMAAFRHLAHDLEHLGGAFLNGSDAELESLFTQAAENPRPTGFAAIAGRNS